MASRSTQTALRLLKQSAPSTSRLTLARPLHTTPSTAFSSSSTSRAPSHDGSVPGTRVYAPPAEAVQAHLQSLLSPLGITLSEDLAERAMTSKAVANVGGLVKDGAFKAQHNEKLVFVGRRALRMHLTIFLTRALANQPQPLARYLSQKTIDLLLETRALGAGAGKALKLENAMRWREVRNLNGEASGLFKSRGAALEALQGAVYLEHGIAASDKVFHEVVLPHLDFEARLASALDAGEAQVGVEPPVIRSEPQQAQPELTS